MKTFSSKSFRSKIFLTGAFSCAFALTALAQNTGSASQIGPDSVASAKSPKSIGPAPANSPQNHILANALSPQTRKTLEEAMNSFPATQPK
jgi:hypothetical protein